MSRNVVHMTTFRSYINSSFICRCDPSICFLLHDKKGVLKHMSSKHKDKVIPKKGESTIHLTIPYQLPIRVNCESNSTVLEAIDRIKRWTDLKERKKLDDTVVLHMFAETDDLEVVGAEKTVYDDKQFNEDEKYVADTPLYSSFPVSQDQKEKLLANHVDVYEQLQTLNKENPTEFPSFPYTWDSLLL